MSLKPVLKNKVDELFLRWLSEPETQAMLKESLRQIQQGEPLTVTASSSSKSSSKGQSPRIRPGSPPSSKLPSPRSPRRPLTTKNNHRGQNHNGSAKYTVGYTLQSDLIVKEEPGKELLTHEKLQSSFLTYPTLSESETLTLLEVRWQ